jgi:sulfate adenylyltransferase subunit 2
VKAFHPAPLPFPLLHVDTGHNFPEVIDYRDRTVDELGAELLVASVQEAIDQGRVAEDTGPRASRNQLQTESLLRATRDHQLDVLMGGARRDEEKARAKERVFSYRDEFGQWNPKQQRPELWNLYYAHHRSAEQVRVFPISNWTELDVYQYVAEENIPLPSIYFAHRRSVFARDGMLMADSPFLERYPSETTFEATVRFRTVGDMTCTGAFESTASTIGEVMLEVAKSRVTERGASRADDKVAETAMEDRKREGYF